MLDGRVRGSFFCALIFLLRLFPQPKFVQPNQTEIELLNKIYDLAADFPVLLFVEVIIIRLAVRFALAKAVTLFFDFCHFWQLDVDGSGGFPLFPFLRGSFASSEGV